VELAFALCLLPADGDPIREAHDAEFRKDGITSLVFPIKEDILL